MSDPLISICIPAYERVDFLRRLLDSIKIQTFRRFEVIITDDSTSSNIQTFIESYNSNFQIQYYRNTPSLGSANNMHEGFKYANSNWIKIIHDDDWLASPNTLQSYADAIAPELLFIFSGYNSYFENTGRFNDETISQKKFQQLVKKPSLIFAKNTLGPPSVLMIHKSVEEFYDSQLKWFVDVEYFFRILPYRKAKYIDSALINVSYNDSQITNYTKTNPAVIIPESLYILNKHPESAIAKVLAYDSWWRAFRNIGISSIKEVERYSNGIPIPSVVRNILTIQRITPKKIIKTGLFSKILMYISYIINK